jgi:hypothetical protein
LKTAAGVAGGVMLAEGISSMFHHNQQPQEIVEVIEDQPNHASNNDGGGNGWGNDNQRDDNQRDDSFANNDPSGGFADNDYGDDSGGFSDDDDSYV